MILMGIVLPQVIDDVRPILLVHEILITLVLNDIADPLFLILQLTSFFVFDSDVKLSLESIVLLGNVHKFFVSQIFLELVYLVSLSF